LGKNDKYGGNHGKLYHVDHEYILNLVSAMDWFKGKCAGNEITFLPKTL
jgi:hypothetical protein